MRLIKLTFVKLANSIEFLKVNVAVSDINWILSKGTKKENLLVKTKLHVFCVFFKRIAFDNIRSI